ncbi:MAG TPA: DinB family protein [Candidatus Deferrimicrobium sp.]|nr:DinB family protein [Candidatus Deferrimicrobium sp.]
MSKRTLIVQPAAGYPPRIGTYLAMLDDVRRRTKRYVEGLSAEQLSWHPQPNVESIGTLLLHIAATEFSYIQEDIIRRPMGEEWLIAYPIRFGRPQVTGEQLPFYLRRLDDVREETCKLLLGFSDDDLNRLISPLDPGDSTSGPVEYSIEWILYHLVEHEAHHKGQIAVMKRLLPV